MLINRNSSLFETPTCSTQVAHVNIFKMPDLDSSVFLLEISWTLSKEAGAVVFCP